ncbi:MAG TPA: amidohydrolase, partial [Woeseiaceae bacterium]|nr:amidohydrolase [Woeseiaceae bacterium]
NSAALELAGVDADTPDVDGGEIVRDGERRPTGILKDNAMALVASAVPAPGEALRDRQVRAAMAYVASNGVTTVHDMGSFADMAAYRRLHADDALITRIYSVVPLAEWQTLVQEVAANGTGDEWLRIGGLKGFMDGSLGSHTAAFFEPFTDTPDDRGLYVSDPADVREWVAAADGAGLHVMIHAIGDRAIDELLDIYAELGAGAGAERPAERGAEPAATSTAAPGAERASGGDAGASRERRLRMEHAQHIRPADIPRFTELGVIASMQPYHAIDDGRWAEAVIGPERIQTTYAFRSLLDAGARLAFGSDWPVAPATPLEGIYAAVTRRTLDGATPDGWVPEQEITVEEALRAYTADAAYASFDEDRKGMLRPGWLADMVLVDRDLTAVPPETLGDARVLATIVGGEVVFEAGGEP